MFTLALGGTLVVLVALAVRSELRRGSKRNAVLLGVGLAVVGSLSVVLINWESIDEFARDQVGEPNPPDTTAPPPVPTSVTTIPEPQPLPDCDDPAIRSLPGVIVGDGTAPVLGTAGDDILLGTDGPDELRGDGGDDLLCGAAGDDILDGGPGDDTLRGDRGADLLLGGDGDDTLFGGADEDLCDGGAGIEQARGCEGRTNVETLLP